MTSYEVFIPVGKKNVRSERSFDSIVRARAFAVRGAKSRSSDYLMDHPTYIKEEGANDKDWIGKVEYYPGEGLVWCVKNKYRFDYYPLRSNGTLGKKHQY